MEGWPKYLTIDYALKFSLRNSLRYARALTAVSLILIAGAVFVGRHITANQTWVGELPSQNPASIALNFVENNYGGVMPFYVVFSGSSQQLSSRISAMVMSEIAATIRSHDLAPTVHMPFDHINFLLSKNPEPLELKEIDDQTFAELLGAAESFQRQQKGPNSDIFWSKNKDHVRIQGFLPNTSTDVAENFRHFLQATVAKYQVPGITIHATGAALISSRALHNIVNDMASSIGLALILISLFVALIFRSLRYMFIAVLPNILPIALTIAFMHVFAVDVRLATGMIFSMALGLSIDACIHLLCRMEEEAKRSDRRFEKLSMMRQIHRAFHGSGRPIIYTTFILLSGFSIMIFSQFLALRDFALISAIVLLTALVADIILLPALLMVTRRRKS